MAKYKLVFKSSIKKDLRSVPKADVAKILRRIDSLADNPRPEGALKLSGTTGYRIRQGNYRILYEIEDEIVTITIIRVGHRRDVYR